MSNIENLSTAFKHINIYDILEPQKVHNVQVGTLIDISDDKPKPNEELIGSFIDKVTKPKFDILDVFENIYVTPQHLEPQNKNDLDRDIFIREDSSNDEVDSMYDNACANVQTKLNKAPVTNLDSKTTQFSFPKLHRFDEKSICNDIDDIFQPKAKLNENNNKTSAPFNDSVHNAIKIDTDQNISICDTSDLKTIQLQNFIISTKENKDTNSYPFTPPNAKSGDLKDDFIIPKLIPKKQEDLTFSNKSVQQFMQSQSLMSSKEIKDSNNCLSALYNTKIGEEFSQPIINLNIGKCAIASEVSTVNKKPIYQIEKPLLECKKEDPNTLFFKSLQDFLNQPPHDFKTTEINKDSASMVPKAKVCVKTVHTPQNLVEKDNYLINLYQYNIKCSLIDENKVIKSLNHPPIPVLQTIKLDKKLFAKRIIKTESEKIRYAKGPDIYEKSLILPQIMGRLMVKNKNEAAKKNVIRKFILDCQNNGENEETFVTPELVTEIITKDCNKERLKALQVRKAFDEFIKLGKI